MNFQPDESQLKALATWYDKDNPLHLDPRHAVIKLAGEAGEILDLYGKHEYKPNFSWWNCKHCGYGDASHSFDSYKTCPYLSKTNDNIMRGIYTPLILDELGDYSYYLRILAYQKGVSFEELCKNFKSKEWDDIDILGSLSLLNRESANALEQYLIRREVSSSLKFETHIFLAILSKLDTTLEQVLELNYKKLNSEPTNHGWKNAKMKTIADCPPMNPK